MTLTIGSAVDAVSQSFVPDWVQDAVFYQVFPERFANGDTSNDPPGTEPWGGKPTPRNYFGGDLQGILQRLDYLSSLGINALYLTPIFDSPTNHKYHTRDYLAIDPHFGDDAVFRKLVDSCHARGIRIILDAVYNHTGVDFFAFQDIKRRGAESQYLGWYNIYGLPISGPSKPNYEGWWGYGDLPRLMTTNPDVVQYLFRVTRHWMDFGIDGWRLDVPNEVPHQFWIEWRKLVKSINRDAYIVGEIWDDARPWLRGDQFDAVMNYRFRKACLDFFVNDTISVSRFDSTLRAQLSDYPADVNFVLQNLLGSHDTERLLTLCKGDTASMKLAMVFQMSFVGAPMVYYGDEVGMTGGKDPGCRGTMVWDPRKQNADLLAFTRQVISVRNAHPALRRGSYTAVLVDDKSRVYAFDRATAGETVRVILNSGSKAARVTIPDKEAGNSGTWTSIWPAADSSHPKLAYSRSMTIPAKSGAIFVRSGK